VGRSGQYLVQLLKLIGLERGDVFIANVVKHRPPENRDPLPDEITACRAYLDQQEQVIDPLLIVTLGRFSMARYFPNGKITAIHGQAKFDERRAYLPLFHPAAVLRNPTLQEAMATDIKRIPQLLAEVKARRATVETANKAAEDTKPKPPPTQLSLF
jgi:DNA polymerase